MKTAPPSIGGLDPLLSIEDLAEYLGVPVTTIYDWRVDGKGPCGVRVGRHVKFTVTDSSPGSRTTARRDRGSNRTGGDLRWDQDDPAPRSAPSVTSRMSLLPTAR